MPDPRRLVGTARVVGASGEGAWESNPPPPDYDGHRF